MFISVLTVLQVAATSLVIGAVVPEVKPATDFVAGAAIGAGVIGNVASSLGANAVVAGTAATIGGVAIGAQAANN